VIINVILIFWKFAQATDPETIVAKIIKLLPSKLELWRRSPQPPKA